MTTRVGHWRTFEVDGTMWCINPHGIVMVWDGTKGDYAATFRLDKGPTLKAAEAEAERLGLAATCGRYGYCRCAPRW